MSVKMKRGFKKFVVGLAALLILLPAMPNRAVASKVSPAFSQGAYALSQGRMLLQLYAGGVKLYYASYDTGNGRYVSWGAAYQPGVSFEYAVVDGLFGNGMGSLTVGGYFGYTIPNWMHIDTKVALHVQLLEKLSVYGGTVLGVGLFFYDDSYYTVNLNGDRVYVSNRGTRALFDGDYFLGVRYTFTPLIGLSLEVQPGSSRQALPFMQLALGFQF